MLSHCSRLTILPELHECVTLKELQLWGCSSLTALPERLPECASLRLLSLNSCSSLISMPDLSGLVSRSGLEKLRIDWGYQDCGLPAHLKPWKESGYKACSLSP
jgi:hypothetical protein|eukprot:4686836-Prymnesium_polylepis.1